jgi:hypothetical protein
MNTDIYSNQSMKFILIPLLLALGIWLFKLFFIITIPLRNLAISPWLIDDSFIIMRVARNIALGHGYSFDGVNPTTGVPMLWTLLSSNNHFYFDIEAAAKITIIQSAFLGSISTVIVFYIAKYVFNTFVAWMAFVFSSLSMPLFFNSMNGMETSLYVCLGLGGIYLFTIANLQKDVLYYIGAGLVFGLMILTRIDALILISSSLFTFFILNYSPGKYQQKNIQISTIFVSVILVFLSLGMMWNFTVSNTLFPSNQLGRRYLYWYGHSVDQTIRLNDYIGKIALNSHELSNLISVITGIGFISLLSILYLITKQRYNIFLLNSTFYIIIYSILLIAYQGYFPDVHGLRYLQLIGYLLSIFISAFIHDLIYKLHFNNCIRISLCIFSLLFLLFHSYLNYNKLTSELQWFDGMNLALNYSDLQVNDYWQLEDWINNNLPLESVIAAKDHGRLAYFTENRIVDLAGIIEPNLIKHLKSGDINAYLDNNDVQYIVMPKLSNWIVHRLIIRNNMINLFETNKHILYRYQE